MRHPTCVASVAACEGGRLQLVPRFRTDETLSSWLERFAGGYGMTVRDFTQWVGYRQSQPYEGLSRIDLDIDPPADLAPVLSRVSGLTAQVIEAQRMIPDSTLLPHLRRTYCAQCWAEEGPYRRREWASSWSLVCTHHGRLLAEKPPPRPPFEPDHEQSWLPFYRARQSWQDTGLAWQGERWRRICAALGVEPHTEFLRARLWFRGLQMLADRVIPQRRPSESSKIFPGGSTNLNSTLNTAPSTDWCIKRDLVLYASMRFRDRSLLQALDEAIPTSQLLQDRVSGDLCILVAPQVGYDIRLFAAVVAMHLWERLAGQPWRCGHSLKLERFFESQSRGHDEDWWLEKRLRQWSACRQAAGRQLFHRQDPWVLPPPWERCREVCLRFESGVVIGTRGRQLPAHWRCRWVEGKDYGIAGRPGVASGYGRVRKIVY
jgi:hypothetical protein